MVIALNIFKNMFIILKVNYTIQKDIHLFIHLFIKKNKCNTYLFLYAIKEKITALAPDCSMDGVSSSCNCSCYKRVYVRYCSALLTILWLVYLAAVIVAAINDTELGEEKVIMRIQGKFFKNETNEGF